MKLFAWITPQRKPWVLVGLLILLGYGGSGGCYAQQMPEALTATERAGLAAAPLPYVVAVVPWDTTDPELRGRSIEAYAKPVADALSQGRAFTRVVLDLQRTEHADLAATAAGDYCNTAIIPLFTIVSLGIIPTIFTDTNCFGVIFRSAGDAVRSDTVGVHYAQKGRVVMGWLAIPVGFLPGWTHGEAATGSRYRDRVRLEVLKHREELAKLVK